MRRHGGKATVNTVCSACGEQNAAGAQFCSHCGAYLGWQDGANERRAPADETALVSDGPPVTVAATEPPSPAAETADERGPFEAGGVVVDVTLALDGSPTSVTVNVANTSTVVDSYVVEAVDAPPWLVVHPGQTSSCPPPRARWKRACASRRPRWFPPRRSAYGCGSATTRASRPTATSGSGSPCRSSRSPSSCEPSPGYCAPRTTGRVCAPW